YFYLTPESVVRKRGIFYRQEYSIVYPKIDNLTRDQDMIHKLFKTGSIGVSTLGSGLVELYIDAIPDFQEFYNHLRKKYKK
ncbi:MAG: PH domain-containing protein, partial [Planctomycetota bacterium]